MSILSTLRGFLTPATWRIWLHTAMRGAARLRAQLEKLSFEEWLALGGDFLYRVASLAWQAFQRIVDLLRWLLVPDLVLRVLGRHMLALVRLVGGGAGALGGAGASLGACTHRCGFDFAGRGTFTRRCCYTRLYLSLAPCPVRSCG